MNRDFASFLDTLRKMDALNRPPSGGSQYTPQVALGPSASAARQQLMQKKKVSPVGPMALSALIRKQK